MLSEGERKYFGVAVVYKSIRTPCDVSICYVNILFCVFSLLFLEPVSKCKQPFGNLELIWLKSEMANKIKVHFISKWKPNIQHCSLLSIHIQGRRRESNLKTCASMYECVFVCGGVCVCYKLRTTPDFVRIWPALILEIIIIITINIINGIQQQQQLLHLELLKYD